MKRIIVLTVLAVLLMTAQAQASVVVKETLGRNAPTYTSYPNDPTPTSKWIASAQGESLDTDGNGSADSLRSRAAVFETYGIIRARIQRVETQALTFGFWSTIQTNPTDKVSEATRAHPVQYTSPTLYCRTDPSLKSLYRSINFQAIRRDDNIVAYRTTYSHHYEARMLDIDPRCPEPSPTSS